MRKLFSLFTALVLVLYASASFAAVGIRVNGQPYGTATDINLTCGAGANSQPSADGSIFSLNCSPNLAESGIANGGATSVASNVAAVPVSFSYVRKVIDTNGDAAFINGTLANGVPGQVITILAAGTSPLGSGGQYTITPVTSTGFKSIKLTVAGDVVSLLYIDDSFGWTISSYDPASTNSITVILKN